MAELRRLMGCGDVRAATGLLLDTMRRCAPMLHPRSTLSFILSSMLVVALGGTDEPRAREALHRSACACIAVIEVTFPRLRRSGVDAGPDEQGVASKTNASGDNSAQRGEAVAAGIDSEEEADPEGLELSLGDQYEILPDALNLAALYALAAKTAPSAHESRQFKGRAHALRQIFHA